MTTWTSSSWQFEERGPGEWWYTLKSWRFSRTEGYEEWGASDEYGPFDMFETAYTHLNKNHPNPGSYTEYPLPGCKHDRLSTRKPWLDRNADQEQGFCMRCGRRISTRDEASWREAFLTSFEKEYGKPYAEVYTEDETTLLRGWEARILPSNYAWGLTMELSSRRRIQEHKGHVIRRRSVKGEAPGANGSVPELDRKLFIGTEDYSHLIHDEDDADKLMERAKEEVDREIEQGTRHDLT